MKSLVREIARRVSKFAGKHDPADNLLPSACYRLPLPLEPDHEKGWKMYHQFRGATRNGLDLSCHASVLMPGHCPHEPHVHTEEEILFMLAGEAELILPQESAGDGRRRVQPGDFVYYPSFYPHSLQAVGPQPASYLMFKWSSRRQSSKSQLGFIPVHTLWPDPEQPGHDGYRGRGLFEGPTHHLHKLHCHSSSVDPGGGYEAHLDTHDVAILLLEGECEILGERVGPGTVVFCAADEPHGMRNPGTTVARYLVFEFHGAYRRFGRDWLLRQVRGNH